MSLITGLESWWATTEADVIAFIVKVKNGLPIIEAELAAALQWVEGEVPTVNAAIGEINGVLQTVAASGVVTIPPAVGTAIQDANKAVAGLNAYAASLQSSTGSAGSNQAAAVLAGYTAIKQAQSATTLATLSLVTTPPATTATAAPAPAAS